MFHSDLLLLLALIFLSINVGHAFVAPSSVALRPTALDSHLPAKRILQVSSSPRRRVAATTHLSMSSNNPALALYEKYQDALPSAKVIEACSTLSAKGKVIASDVAAQAGVPLRQAERDLQLLASLTAGDIAVSSDGDLLYSFPSDLKGELAQRNSQYKLQQNFEKVWPTLFWGVRVSFGVALGM